MKAFIFNSGIGKRLGDLTQNTPKALVRMETGETILGRQIRLLRDNGIKDYVISTGPFHNQIVDFVKQFTDLSFTLINSDDYQNTNSIYSMYISRNSFDDDFLILHGDLVFDDKIVKTVLNNNLENLVLINRSIPKPEKDFKGRVELGFLREISVSIFDDNCYALQPFYKLNQSTIKSWLEKVTKFVVEGNVKVYAENALNQLLKDNIIGVLDYSNNYIDEIDNKEDYFRVSKLISLSDYRNQDIRISNTYAGTTLDYLKNNKLKKPFVVHGRHITTTSDFNDLIKCINPVLFSGFSPNPKFEEVLVGLRLFEDNKCDSIIAIGGGSCLDVAKAIKYFSNNEVNIEFISNTSLYVDLKLIAVPTTAGTGSESTRYSVIYHQGIKQSLTNDSLLPNMVILIPDLLKDLPIYQRKSTLLDSLCQAIEGYWSVNATQESMTYSEESIRLILKNYLSYVHGGDDCLGDIMLASNYAGKSINISQTTAPHAMSYMITSLTGLSHGHAVSLSLPYVYQFMLNNLNKISNKISLDDLLTRFTKLSELFGARNYSELTDVLFALFSNFELETPPLSEKSIDLLVSSVNSERLKNNPVQLDTKVIEQIYRLIFKKIN